MYRNETAPGAPQYMVYTVHARTCTETQARACMRGARSHTKMKEASTRTRHGAAIPPCRPPEPSCASVHQLCISSEHSTRELRHKLKTITTLLPQLKLLKTHLNLLYTSLKSHPIGRVKLKLVKGNNAPCGCAARARLRAVPVEVWPGRLCPVPVPPALPPALAAASPLGSNLTHLGLLPAPYSTVQ